jgi:VanZ family protein
MTALGRAALAAITLVILALTLFPVAGAEKWLLSWKPAGLRSAADALANVLLFVPFGVVAALLLRGWRPVAAAALLSVCIELLQLGIPGRYTSPYDLAFNTLGAAVGVVLARSAAQWLNPPRWVAVVLTAVSLVAALAVLAGGGLLFRPAVPTTALYGQWTASFGDLETYEGRVTAARVGSLDVPSHRIRESDELRSLLLQNAPVRVDAVAGPPPAGLAPLFSIFDARAVEVMLIGVDAADLVIRHRMRSTELRLDEPHFRVYDALRGVRAGDEITVEIWRPGAELCLRVTDPRGSRTRCDFGYTVGDTWALLMFPVPRPLDSLLRVLWIVALLVPAGFWIRRAPLPAAAVAALAVAVLALAPRFADMLPTPLVQLVAAVAGVALGYLLGRWSATSRMGSGPTHVARAQRKAGRKPV